MPEAFVGVEILILVRNVHLHLRHFVSSHIALHVHTVQDGTCSEAVMFDIRSRSGSYGRGYGTVTGRPKPASAPGAMYRPIK